MSEVLTVDFKQMPWSRQSSSWQYHGAEVWASVRQTLKGQGERLLIRCPASRNTAFEGLIELSSSGFQAEITVTGPPASPHVPAETLTVMNAGQFTQFLYGLGVKYTAPSAGVITIILDEVPYPEKDEQRADYMLGILWDLQLLAVKVLSSVFEPGDTIPSAG